MCNHCDDAPCHKAAQGGAVRKRPDGIVIIDPEKAKGQKKIMHGLSLRRDLLERGEGHPAGVAI